MKKMVLISGILLGLGLIFSSGSRAEQKSYEELGRERDQTHLEDIPKAYQNDKGVSVHFEGWTTQYDRRVMLCRVANLSEKTVYFRGYGIQDPWYLMQKDDGKAWVDYAVGWFCGTGLRRPELPPGKSSVFWADFPDNASAVRVGIQYWGDKLSLEANQSNIAWSEAIKQDSGKKDSPPSKNSGK